MAQTARHSGVHAMPMSDAGIKELKNMLGAARQHVLNFGL